jgi:hypothetical protein
MKNLTKVTRESVGEWIFKLLSKPEWVESKFRYWAFYMMIAGFVLLLGTGLGVPLKVTTEAPFIEWETQKAGEGPPPINLRAIEIGIGLIIIGALLSIPWKSVADPEEDKRWPQVEGDSNPEAPVLFVESPLNVDVSQIALMLQQFGRKWEAATVRWPKSSHRLLEEAKRLSQSSHMLNLSQAEILFAFNSLLEELQRAPKLESKFEAAIPGLVARCEAFSSDELVAIIRSFLIRGNYRAHEGIRKALQDIKRQHNEVAVPENWTVFDDEQSAQCALYGVSHMSELKREFLIGVGEESVHSRDGDFVEVTAPGVFLRHRVILESGTPRMLVPDAELNVAEMGGRLPSKYKGMMLFSRIGPVGGWDGDFSDSEVSSDTDLIALAQKYAVERKSRAPTEDS